MLPKPILAALIALAVLTAACKLTSQTESRTGQLPGDSIQSTQNSGKEIYLRMGCAECHDQATNVLAPTLEGLYGEMVSLEGGEKILADESYIRESILSPGARIVRGYKAIMPNFKSMITDEQVDALVDYIRSLAK